eukprot:augustus_masked-scaffold_29-processed-gene-0.65-mRNA-1 protein AED:1.00 eAED:1.00 QI:0/-1/0/0/-1/1/1/0/259
MSFEEYQVRTIEFNDFASSDANTLNALKHELAEVGLFGLVNIPGFTELSRTTLGASSNCANSAALTKGQKNVFNFADGTKRITFAAENSVGLFPGEISVDPTGACDGFVSHQAKLREEVTSLISLFTEVLVDAYGSIEFEDQFFDLQKNANIKTYADLFHSGSSLDHFHTYKAPHEKTESGFTLDLHTDHGLFIALTPAKIFDVTGKEQQLNENDFFIQLASGMVVQPDLQGIDLLFMVGEGLAHWGSSENSRFRAVPH